MPAITIYQHCIPLQTYSPVGAVNIAGMARSYNRPRKHSLTSQSPGSAFRCPKRSLPDSRISIVQARYRRFPYFDFSRA